MASASEREKSVAQCNEIIARIKAKPELWCSTHPLYMNRAVNKNFWAKTSADLGVDENIIRKRWKHLKDQYRKELKKSIEKSLPEDGVSWQYYEGLSFLRDEVLRDKSRTPALVEDSDDSEEEEREPKVRIVETKTDENMQLHMIYKGLMETKAVVEERMKILDEVVRHDPDYMYLMSLQPTLKQLTEIQKLQLKGRINEWLLEALTTDEYAHCDNKYIVSDVHVDEQK